MYLKSNLLELRVSMNTISIMGLCPFSKILEGVGLYFTGSQS